MKFIEKIGAKKLLFLCHQNADPDALCSAYTFSKVLKRLNPRLKIGITAVEGLSEISKGILAEIPVKLNERPRLSSMDLFILFDTNTFQQLGDIGEHILSIKKPIVILDHHASNPMTNKKIQFQIIDEKARSTCELVYSLLEEERLTVSRKEALCLFLGMAYDTRHFTLASARSFKIAAKLVELGVDPEKAIALLIKSLDRSEKIARLKAAQRAKILSFNDWVIVFSRISSHQASAARALLALGADLAVVGGEKDGALKISMRAAKGFSDKTGIHLGRDLAQPLGESIGGAGGGHEGAAGINGGTELDRFFVECERILAKKLNV